MASYRFENLAHYMSAWQRVKSDYYYNREYTRDGDKLILLVSEKAARDEEIHNFQTLSKKLKDAGASYLINTNRWMIQVLCPRSRRTDVSQVVEEYYTQLLDSTGNEVYGNKTYFETSKEGNSLIWTPRRSMMPKWTPKFYDLINQQSIDKKKDQTQIIWDQGWLSLRGYGSSVARYCYGLPDDIKKINQIRDLLSNLDHASIFRANIIKTYNSINRHCNYPNKGWIWLA